MQVMNGGEFDQQNVLIGKGGKSLGFGVTNDPILMSMLSTGLYGNPLRTMIQEIMFNAWDAHHMGNCQDKPIDLYLNDTSGLIVRDYGPGISPDDMHPIYCIYGNSTKRNDDGKTGGFGLGSKSPYAYTDSFTVTSQYDGKKSMYLMNRVSEENDGGPGMTPVIEGIPTQESGLTVTVPFKNDQDRKKALEYIRDISHYSGIKLNVHYENKNVELIESESLAPGAWTIDDEYNTSGLLAVYGGVRYTIPQNDYYADEYAFIHNISRMMGGILIGFKPNSLTPLPNREGLNLNDRTVESIKSTLEIIVDVFKDILVPAYRTVLEESMTAFKSMNIQPHYLANRWITLREDSFNDILFEHKDVILKNVFKRCPDNVFKNTWESICITIWSRTDTVRSMIGTNKSNQMIYLQWVKNFPDKLEYKQHFLGMPYIGLRSYHRVNTNIKTITAIEVPRTIEDIINARNIATKASDNSVSIRIKYSDKWEEVSNIRNGGKASSDKRVVQDKIKLLTKEGKIIVPTIEHNNRLWLKSDGKELVDTMFMKKVIIVGTTITSLKETSWNFQAMFSPPCAHVDRYSPYYYSNFTSSGDYYCARIVAALVIHKKNDGYTKAVQALKDAGYDVLEAEIPKPKAKPVKDPNTPRAKPVTTYPLVDLRSRDWASVEEVSNPTCYLYLTPHKAANAHSYDLPNKSLIRQVLNRTPRMVILQNKARETKLINQNIPDFSTKLHDIIKDILSNERRFKTIVMYNIIYEESSLPKDIINIHEIRNLFGVPYIRSNEMEKFIEDFDLLTTVKSSSSSEGVNTETYMLIKDAFYNIKRDPSVSSVRQICQKNTFFHKTTLAHHVHQMKPGEKKMFAQKLARFMRTI